MNQFVSLLSGLYLYLKNYLPALDTTIYLFSSNNSVEYMHQILHLSILIGVYGLLLRKARKKSGWHIHHEVSGDLVVVFGVLTIYDFFGS